MPYTGPAWLSHYPLLFSSSDLVVSFATQHHVAWLSPPTPCPMIYFWLVSGLLCPLDKLLKRSLPFSFPVFDGIWFSCPSASSPSHPTWSLACHLKCRQNCLRFQDMQFIAEVVPSQSHQSCDLLEPRYWKPPANNHFLCLPLLEASQKHTKMLCCHPSNCSLNTWQLTQNNPKIPLGKGKLLRTDWWHLLQLFVF